MIFWICVAILSAATCVLLLRYAYRTRKDWPVIPGVCLGLAVLLLMTGILISRMEYRRFEVSFEIQREYLEEINLNDNGNVLYIADIINANKTLADYQASKKMYGVFSMVPDRVLDLEPIGR